MMEEHEEGFELEQVHSIERLLPISPPNRPEESPPQSRSNGEEADQGRKVTFPLDLSRHASIRMADPDPIALTRALENHQNNDEEPPDRFFGSSAPSSTRASSDGDPEERMNLLREGMEVFVDSGEVFGLPNVSKKTDAEKNTNAAWGLVRSYTGGRSGLMKRKNTLFKAQGEAREKEKEDAEEGGTLGFFESRMREKSENISGDPSQLEFTSTDTSTSMPGLLSSLMALQQQGGLSGASTPGGTSIASSISYDDGGSSSEDEDERIKFITAQREKRRKKSVWGASAVVEGASAVVGTAGKAVVGAVYGGKHKPSVSLSNDPPSPAAVNTVPKALSASRSPMPARSPVPSSILSSESATGMPLPRSRPTSVSTTPLDLPGDRRKSFFGESVNQVKKLGEKVGLDLDAVRTRPSAAKNGAGVFGGLIASTANLAGIAAPAASTIAPSVTRPGYHLSRYSAPVLTTLKSLEVRSSDGHASDDDSHKSIGSGQTSALPSPPILRTQTASTTHSTKSKPGFSLHLKDLPTPLAKLGFARQTGSGKNTPDVEKVDYFMGVKETPEERENREWEKEKRRRKLKKEKRKREEVFIVQHVANILSRQDFIMKLGRAFMMFGAPSHRLEAQMQATARVLEINCQVIYIPGVMLISFGDAATHTSEIKFLKQANGLDLGKLLGGYYVYWNVIHDRISVTDASLELDSLMCAPPKYKLWQHLVLGGLASAFISPIAFYGSFIDCLVSIPLGSLLILVQVVVSKNDLYSSLFEIVIACINAFLAAALASTGQFCFASVASASVVLILPGYIVLCGSLELANRSIISGSVRLVYAVLYALFLGFGLSMGSEVYGRITGLRIIGSTDYTCSALRGLDAPWYRASISPWFFFLCAPCYLLVLALRNGQPFYRKETIVMIVIGASGWVCNYFSARLFPGRPDISSAIGSFVVGLLGNIYGKFTAGSPFVVMVVGVLFQLPTGLANGGLLQFASQGSTSTSTYSAGFSAASSLVQVAIGLTVGLFISAALVNLFGGGRRRGSNLSSF